MKVIKAFAVLRDDGTVSQNREHRSLAIWLTPEEAQQQVGVSKIARCTVVLD